MHLSILKTIGTFTVNKACQNFCGKLLSARLPVLLTQTFCHNQLNSCFENFTYTSKNFFTNFGH